MNSLKKRSILLKNEDGAVLFEFIICLPTAMLLVSVLYEMIKFAMIGYVLWFGVYDGARVTMALDGNVSGGEAVVAEQVKAIPFDLSSTNISCSKGSQYSSCKAVVSFDYILNLGQFKKEITKEVFLPTEKPPQ